MPPRFSYLYLNDFTVKKNIEVTGLKMKLFIDCEFNGFGGELISMALVPYDDSTPFYKVLKADDMIIDPWVMKNVMPLVDKTCGEVSDATPCDKILFQSFLYEYINKWKEITVVADWPDDIKYFCEILIVAPGVMGNTPKLKFEVHRDLSYVSEYPHNALSDAIGIAKAYRQKYPMG